MKIRLTLFAAVLAGWIIVQPPAWADAPTLSPTPSPTPSQLPFTVGWSAQSIGGAAAKNDVIAPMLVVRRQDHGELTLNRSVVGLPLKIGSQSFDRGLGTHSVSEITVQLPAGFAKSFSASVGVNVNAQNAKIGSVVFTLEAGGKELYNSGVRRGGDEPIKAQANIPSDATELLLKVSDAGDGPSSDHADWADAKLTLADGHELYLDAIPAPALWPAAAIPFSFVYDGKPSADFIAKWNPQSKSEQQADRTRTTTTWTDPATKLTVVAEATAFKDSPSVEWLLRITNNGTADSPILENVQALDALLPGGPQKSIALDQIRGDDASPNSFIPMEQDLPAGKTVALAPVGGRPSSGTFPMFALESGGEHLFVAIGWTGQWAANIARDASGTHLKAGMELTHLRLHPGESIRSPRILLLSAHGDRITAHNQFRHLLLDHYVPRVNGQLPKFAVAAQTFNMVFGAGIRPEWATEAGQIAAAKINKAIGCDTLWMDAGWFDGNFPNGVGSWTVKAKEFPRGLGPVGEACRQLGLQFLVWYEPERVAPGTLITREHPQFLLTAGGQPANGGLLNLGDDNTRQWMTDLILHQMDDGKIDHYRNDFNMEPLPYWRANDAPDRQGISEIRYVEGLYKMWDAIRAARPNSIPDDCASGGRRIDLEMVMRSIVQTRTDAAVAPGRSDWHQSETYGLSEFLPLQATIGWETDAYATRSVALAGVCMEWDILDPKFPIDLARAGIEECKANQKFWQGDYYPLTAFSFDTNVMMAWQLDRPDIHEGMVMVFRREDCPYSALQLALRNVDPHLTYSVSMSDDNRHVETRMIRGSEMASLEVHLPNPRSSLLINYSQK